MTERLRTLLHDEAQRLDVPDPAAARVLVAGHRMRRHRRTGVIAGTAAAMALIATTTVVVLAPDSDDDARPAQFATDDLGAVFAVGRTVYLDDGATEAVVDDQAVKSLYYTSEGVLVRHGNNPSSDGGGPQRFSLVTPSGDVEPIDVVTEETVHSTDPDQPYLAYAETVDGVVEVVLWDVSTNTETARVPVPDAAQWGSWPAPPVALDGDLVYVGTSDVARVVDWRTGSVSESEVVEPGFPQVSNGHVLARSGAGSAVVDARTGSVLVQIESAETELTGLSPDGRFALASTFDDQTFEESGDVYEVSTGTSMPLTGAPFDYGWTPDGDLFTLKGDTLTTCSPTTGACESQPLDVRSGADLKYGGQIYES